MLWGKTVTETTGPTTTTAPIVLPTMPPYDVSYPATTDYYWGTIHKTMTDVNGVEDNYEVTAGPFGFGQAISVSSDKEQCVKQNDYNIASDACSGNPSDCDKGLSISVWEKPIFGATVFEAMNNSALASKKYVLSTGGDSAGHPGIAIYHDGLYLVAVVSTGDEYWELKVAGPLQNNTWSNIAIRWEQPGADDGTLDEKTGGLELFVNLKKVGHQVESESSAPAKQALDPTEMMLGCHKDADNQLYRGYNDAEYDELAAWTRKLPDNETLFFFGGYEANFSDIEPDKFQSMLTQVELKDPAQMAFAINILSKMTSTENVDPTTATPTEAASTSSSSGPTAGSPTASTTQSVQSAVQAAGVKQITTMRNIMKTMTNLDNINPDMPYSGFKSAMSLLDVASNLLAEDSFPKWRGLQSKKDEPGSAELVQNLENWLTTMAREVSFTNESDVIDYAKTTDNIMVRVVKMMPDDLAKKGKYFETPDYKHANIKPNMDEWNLPYDRAVVPTDLFADARCKERPVSITMQLFDTYDDVAPMKVNPATLHPREQNILDSRVIAIHTTVDLVRNPDGLIDPSAPDCKPDPDKLKETPVRYKLEHNIKEFSLRQLSFHSEEEQTEIKVRYCVWWNKDIGDFGAWDTTGCSLLKTTDEHTLCACDHFGTFSILAEKVEPKVVPEEKLWLTILRYVGYSLSFLCLIIYIVVIAISGDLKEQFHLMGMNLSIAVLLGSICMLITDIHAVRDDRHACTALGTLLHVFYLAAGTWVAALGHACFKAITSGIVGGRLRAYWFICWGIPLISMGLTYLLFLQDLGDDPRCFIAWENPPKYVFFSPQMVFVFFSFFFGTIVLCNLATPALRKDNLIDDYGTFCRGAALVMLFFDLIWTFGLLTYIRFGFKEPNFYPIFQVLNSWMGVIILVFIGMGSKRWRMVVLGQAKSRRKMLLGYEFGGSKPGHGEKERLGSPEDQRSKASSRPSSRPSSRASSRPSSRPSSGRASPVSASGVDMNRPPTSASDFPSRPASRGLVAGRPGSRTSSATT